MVLRSWTPENGCSQKPGTGISTLPYARLWLLAQRIVEELDRSRRSRYREVDMIGCKFGGRISGVLTEADPTVV